MAPDKRQEILDQLKAAVASFRHCLDLQPDNSHARRDIELVRQWLKYYTDRWLTQDREKRRKETNLVAFLEFLIETQRALRESVKVLGATAPADAYAEPKRLQDELLEEITPLKEKIQAELTPNPSGSGSTPPANPGELQQGIAMLQGWASTVGEKMGSASHHLDGRQAGPAAVDQQSAIDELEKIWEAVIPFHALLARDLADQTLIARSLAPDASATPKPGTEQSSSSPDPNRMGARSASQGPLSATSPSESLGTQSEDLAPVTDSQERTLRRTKPLKIKAEAELARMEAQRTPAPVPKKDDPTSGKDASQDGSATKPRPVDPKLIKAGYQKAIELAPKAVSQMEQAVRLLKQKNPQSAYAPAEEARKILEELQKAQPRNDQPDQKPEDQKKKNEDQQKEDKKDQQDKDQQKKDQEKQEPQKKDQEQKKQEESKKSDEPKTEKQIAA